MKYLKSFLTLTFLMVFVSFFSQDPLVGKAQEFINALNNNDFQKAYLLLNSDLGFKVKPEDLQRVWNQLVSKAGKFVDFRESKSEYKNDYTLVILICKFEKGLVDLHVAIDNMGKVAGFVPKDHK